jgi:hypothetical protein
MKCLYCNHDLEEKELNYHTPMIECICTDCNSTFRWNLETKEIMLICLRFILRQEHMTAMMYFQQQQECFVIQQVPFSMLMHLKFIPKTWNPANIQQKMELYLPFL